MTRLRSILRGAAPLAGLEFASLALALVTLPYLMRVLGPTEFGRYAFGVAAGAALAVFVDYGFNQQATKDVAQTPAAGPARGELFWSVQLAKLQLAAVSLPVFFTLAWLFDLQPTYGPVLGVALPAAAGALAFPQWYLQGTQRYPTMAASLAASRVLTAFATLLLVRTHDQAALAVLLQTLTGCTAGLFALCDRDMRASLGRPALQWRASWVQLRLGGTLFLSTAAVSVYTSSVPLLLGAITSPATVGLFSVGDKIRAAVQTLLTPIGVAAFPKLSLWIKVDRLQGITTARSVLALQVALGAAAAAGIALLAEPAIRLLAGEAFLPSVAAARWLGLCIVFTAISNTLGVQMMLPLGLVRPYSMVLGLCAAVGALLVWLLAPAWGALGAATAVVATEALVAILMAGVLRYKQVL